MSMTLETARTVAPLIELVDKEFWAKHPDIDHRHLERNDADAKLRRAWKELFRERACDAARLLREASHVVRGSL